ncbi:MAG: hypothetical protein M1299_05540, partial [Firmicutes bacterium]|nr:hypothetical protein [Bacillota bacterium]
MEEKEQQEKGLPHSRRVPRRTSGPATPGRPSEAGNSSRFNSERRELLKAGTIGVALAAVLGPTLAEGAPAPVKGAPAAPPPLPRLGVAEEDTIVRMQRDLERALKKPVDQRRWVMV